jgi:DNA-binding CsgD family transcriptional regulator
LPASRFVTRLAAWWRRLRRKQENQPAPHLSLPASQEMINSLEQLAGDEKRGAAEVAAELLSGALLQRQAAGEHLVVWQSLSPREQQVAALACLHYTNRQIAASLVLSRNTVKTHLRHVLHKFGVHSRDELRRLLSSWDFAGWLEEG